MLGANGNRSRNPLERTNSWINIMARVAKEKLASKGSTANIGCEAKLWLAAEKLSNPRLKGVLPKDYGRRTLSRGNITED